MIRKLVITAPTSVVSRNFIQYLGGRYDVVTVGRRDSDIPFDFSKDQSLCLPEYADSVIHFAGQLRAGTAEEICEMVNTNVSGVIKLCEAAKRYHAAQVILISTINTTLPVQSPYYSYYCMTKSGGEEAAKLYCRKEGVNLCIIRPSQIFGLDLDYGRTQPLLYSMIRNAAQNKPITIYGNHDALRNYIYADNVFRVIHEAVIRRSTDIIDVIGSPNIKLGDAARTIIDCFKSSSEIIFLKDQQNMEDNAFYTDCNYFDKWGLPFVSFEEAVQLIWKEISANENRAKINGV